MKKYKVGVLGSSGRMGQEISQCLVGNTKLEAFLGWSNKNGSSGYKHNVTNLNSDFVNNVDLWIDFSTPEALMQAIPIILRTKKPVISGTTGLSENQFKRLKSISNQAPLLWSSNMSLGVAVLGKVLENLQMISHYDFKIEECHHKLKKDSPSGTAISLQKKLEKVIQKKVETPLSLRGGGVIGDHKVWAFGEEEVLCFEHRAIQRKVFARGALWAAEKLLKKPKGLYEFGDLLR